jgi:small subunit ribosomal protein S4e
LILLRDVLGYVDSKKEARYALNQDSVLVNGEPVSDESRPIGMFDILAFTQRDEYYRVFPDEGGRLALTAITPEAADSRLGKVVRKQQVAGGAFQLTLHDGTNVRVEDAEEAADYSTNDSVVVDNETKEIVAHFPYEEGALVTAVDGQHAGEIGEIAAITVTPGSGKNTVRVARGDDTAFETVEGYVVVIDEKFTGSAATDAGGEADTETDTDADTETDTDADTDTDTDSEVDVDVDVATDGGER